ncbi:MAG: hypothetical protein ACI4OP_01835 [Candidatus Coprovivens sp.]
MKINIVDAGCGVGKTTALINLINNDTSNQKYIFITPFLSEVERIKKSCPDKNFVSPDENNKTKLEHFSKLINEGRNIVTTHALFKKIDSDRVSIEALQNYVLIMDEVADIVEELPVSKSDLKLLSNKVTIHPRTHMVEWNDNDYQGKFDEYKRMIKLNNIFAYVDQNNNIVSMMWLFPYRVFQAFQQIYILTYMFDGQIQKKYFDYFGASYANWYVKDFNLTPTPQIYDYRHTKSLINVCQDQKLNEVGDNRTALSISWFNRNRRTQEMVTLQNNIRSFFRSHAKVSGNKMLWTTFKEYKYNVKRNGFAKGFAPINCRATNEYSNKTAIAYIGNRFFKPTIKNFFTFNNIPTEKQFEDKFALSELVQFVFRSAIRNDKPIDVYIPSKRMRDLFEEWLKKPND